ncbi:MAG: peptide ABC transporter substrate-binding protein [Deltaproteobacteria bacterium]|nr:peptide ABC transporter substrate-binding protein [Deltaproteobacteria bacterium]
MRKPLGANRETGVWRGEGKACPEQSEGSLPRNFLEERAAQVPPNHLLALSGLICLIAISSLGQSRSLTIGLQGTFQASHPLQEKEEAASFVDDLLHTPLLFLNAKWQWKCGLCSEVPSLANKRLKIVEKGDSEALELSFNLSPNSFWDDGTPVTTDDLLLTWDLARQARKENRPSRFPDAIEDIVVEDKRTFKIMMNVSGEPLRNVTELFLVPRHLEKVLWDKANSWHSYLTQSFFVTDPTLPGLYNGPYSLRHASKTLTLSANEHGRSPFPFQQIDVHMFPSSAPFLSKSLLGGFDLIPSHVVWDDNLEFFRSLETSKDIQHDITVGETQFFEHIDFNLQNPVFRDVQVRRALAFAIDKDVLISQILEEWAIPALSFCHPQSPYFDENAAFYEFSLPKARTLLSASHWVPGQDGIREKNGRKLTFELWTIQDKLRESFAHYLAKTWGELGVKVSVVLLPLNRFRDAVGKRQFPGMALYAWHLSPYQSMRETFHSSAIPSVRNSYSGLNTSAWNDTEVDNLISQLDTTLPFDKRKKLHASLQIKYAAELPSLPLFFRVRAALLRKEFKNYTIMPSKTGTGQIEQVPYF